MENDPPVREGDPRQLGSSQQSDVALQSDDDTVGITSDSTVSSLFGSDDSRSTTSSGEIPTSLEADVVVPRTVGAAHQADADVVLPRTVGAAHQADADVVLPRTVGAAHQADADVGSGNRDAALTARERCVGSNRGLTWGSASLLGRRNEMEDAVAVVSQFTESTCEHVGGCTAPGSRSSGERSNVQFFGVYDGHGGSQVARFCAHRIHQVVAEEWEKVGGCGGEAWRKRWDLAFNSGFERVDAEVSEGIAPETVGSTAVAVVLSGCQIIASNCGDSRAVLVRGNHTVTLTIDHKPEREDELLRIEGGGGRVINWDGLRVFGVLAMSRAIGDRYLRPWVIPVPEVTFTTRSQEDECLILASDGLWEVMSNEEVGNVARYLLRRHRRRVPSPDVESPPLAEAVANHLVDLAYRRNSSDNISVIVVDLKSKRKRQQR